MSAGRKAALIALVTVALGGATALSVVRFRSRGLEVRLEEVTRRDLVATVTASGNVRPRRIVDISSDVSARVAELLIAEGEDVRAGQVLLRLDPTQFEAALARVRAALSQAEAQASLQAANLLQADRNYERLHSLNERDSVLVSPQQLENAATNVEVARASLAVARHGVEQARASVEEAADRLAKTILRAPIDGRVTRLQVEEGETVIIGTMNNPGSLILTISDLGVVEVVVQVDETDVPELSIGDSARITIDAFPADTFSGWITEIGNSAIRPPSPQAAGGQQAAIDFEVVITLDDPPVVLRPDLSATAEIVTDTRANVLAIPIIALTVRPASDTLPEDQREPRGAAGGQPSAENSTEPELEGVFRARGRRVSYVPVNVGIAGAEQFEVRSGLAVGDTVVAGPYTVIRQLQSGDQVRRLEGPER